MSITLRIVLLIASGITAIWILYRIRKSKVKMEDAIFWICLACILFVLGTFSEVSYWISGLLGIQTPANCVFLIIIALVLEKVFTLSIKVSQLEEKMDILAAELALRCKDNEEKIKQEQMKNEKSITDSNNI